MKKYSSLKPMLDISAYFINKKMARYNHFSEHKYKQIMFSSLKIGDKFRQDFFYNGRRRKDIICIKTGELSYMEERNKKTRTLYSSEIYQVSSYEKK